MKGKLKVIVMMDEGTIPCNINFKASYNKEQSTEYHVLKALKSLGHSAKILGVGHNITEIFEVLNLERPDIVFNLTEQFGDDRKMDKNIVGLLELLDVPSTGTGIMGLMLCRNKALSKRLLKARKIHVPDFIFLPKNKKIRVSKKLRFPLVVKPVNEDGSEGISNASFVKTEDELLDRAKFIHENFSQHAIGEEYIEGREFYISLIGNKKLKVMPPRELHFGGGGNGGPILATYRVKWNKQYREKWKISFNDAVLDTKIQKKINKVCKKTYHCLHLYDYGRIDIRLTPDNQIYVLEANPNPDIAYGEEVAESAGRAGIKYKKLIQKIIDLALERYRKRAIG